MSAQQAAPTVEAIAEIIMNEAATDLLTQQAALKVAEDIIATLAGRTVVRTPRGSLPGEPIEVVYSNHREEKMERIITPLKVYWGHTEWHPQDQWLMDVYDHDRSALRTYALKDCDFPSATW